VRAVAGGDGDDPSRPEALEARLPPGANDDDAWAVRDSDVCRAKRPLQAVEIEGEAGIGAPKRDKSSS